MKNSFSGEGDNDTHKYKYKYKDKDKDKDTDNYKDKAVLKKPFSGEGDYIIPLGQPEVPTQSTKREEG